MSEPRPTIDEMLAWLSNMMWVEEADAVTAQAIRAILVQHRDDDIIQRIASIEIEKECERQKREAIRAFVKRLSERMEDSGIPLAFFVAAHEELAAMEKEANNGTEIS